MVLKNIMDNFIAHINVHRVFDKAYSKYLPWGDIKVYLAVTGIALWNRRFFSLKINICMEYVHISKVGFFSYTNIY